MNQTIKSPVLRKPVRFSDIQMAALDALIELLIPASPDARMPAAKSLLLFADVSDLPLKDKMLFEHGLADLDARSMQRYNQKFAQVSRSRSMELVDALRRENAAFVQSFMTHTVGRYLAHDLVMPLIGLEARPHWPKGHTVEQGDWSLLNPVRVRPKIYRPV